MAVTLLSSAAGGAGGQDELPQRLLAASARGDAAEVAALVREGADPNARDASFQPALLLAVASGRPEAVRALLAAGASPDAGDRSSWTPLHQAVEQGDLASARALLEAGATPDLRSRARGTALDVAEREGRSAIALLLRENGARGSGKSIGDTVCVRPWAGEGYCGRVEAIDRTRFELRVTEIVGCDRGCPARAACSAGRPVASEAGLAPGDRISVPASCLTHTAVR